MRVYLTSLGCRLNEAELETWARDFRQRGHQIVSEPAASDLVVVNTCAVTGEAVKKSRKILHRAHRDNPRAKLVVSGCSATLDPTQTAAMAGVDLVIPNDRKERLVEETETRLDLHAMPDAALEVNEPTLLTRGRQRAFIKVQDGCRYQCTFCIVTLARGEERSRSEDEIIAEINALHAEGIREVVLSGVHLGGYGHDRGSDLARLVRAILDHSAMPRIRLGALEPWDLPPGFWELFEDPRVLPHLHLPLQSGSDEILRRMARRCKRAEFAAIVERARSAVPGFNITTDIIVGFPGETEAHWQQTLEFTTRMGFGHLHIFAFSPRTGTRAADLPDRLPREVIRARSETLHQLGARLKDEQLEQQIGLQHAVLVEKGEQTASNSTTWSGYTPNYHRIRFTAPNERDLEGRIIEIRATALTAEREALIGKPA